MKNYSFSFLIIIFLVLILVSCSVGNKEKKLFIGKKPEQTNISFNNKLTETDTLNYMNYPYLYMGGGVAIGDINNDNIPDIYFTGNMVDDKLYLGKGNMKFEDITDKAFNNLDKRWHTGVTMADVNNDGFLDLYVSVSGKNAPRNNLLYINNQDLTFTESAKEYGIDDPGHSTQGTFFDYDKDGDLDLYIANYPSTKFLAPISYYKSKMDSLTLKDSDRLYRNNGDNTFSDVTVEAGILNFGLSLSVTASDINNDGWTDLYVSNDFAGPDYLYMNNKDGTFRNTLKESTNHTSYFGMGVDIADFNNDGLLDILQLDMTPEDNYRSKANMASMSTEKFWDGVQSGFHHQYMINSIQLNRGNTNGNTPVFSEMSRLAGVSTTDWSWSPLFVDLDNDGWKDIFIANGTRREINNKDYFINLGQGSAFSNDSQLQSSLNIPSEKIDNYAFKNNGDLTFSKTNDDWGLSFYGYSNGASYADLDLDGDLDLVISNIDSTAVIFENRGVDFHKNSYIRFSFKGSEKNPFGIGVKVKIESNDQQQFQELTTTRGFQSSSEPKLHFGVNDLKTIDKIMITWPDDKVEELSNIKTNQEIRVDYANAKLSDNKPEIKEKIFFTDITKPSEVNYKHIENDYNDFEFETLLPHKTSNFGPGLAVADVNGDGLDDFFIGGAANQSGKLYLQNVDGTFMPARNQPWAAHKNSEDMNAVFFDADADGDQDLYIVSGGNEFLPNSKELQDRIYINNGKGMFSFSSKGLPIVNQSGSCVKPFDYDKDGDLDLFVGGRLIPRKYPYPADSYILRNDSKNGKIKFTDVTSTIAPSLKEFGLVTDAVWNDYDQDGDIDLMIVGEWMPITIIENSNGTFTKLENDSFKNTTGWWSSIIAKDMDNDGDDDFIAGNLGLNYKYKAQLNKTFDVFVSDYDKNGIQDIILGYYNDSIQYPVRGRQCSSEQIPNIKRKYIDYNSFARATLEDIYTSAALENSLHYSAQIFASSYIENLGNGKFQLSQLPNFAQLSSINTIIAKDFNNDNIQDLLVAGNLFASEIETPRNDASMGLLLLGKGNGEFFEVPTQQSKFIASKDVKNMSLIKTTNGFSVLIANNNDGLQIFKINTNIK
jgi:hypothetical protein